MSKTIRPLISKGGGWSAEVGHAVFVKTFCLAFKKSAAKFLISSTSARS